MRKNVIFVNSALNLLFAINLRKKLFMAEQFDIVLNMSIPGVQDIIKSRKLEECFDNVYFADYSRVTEWVKIRSIISPKYFFKVITGKEFVEYESVFFWNPTLLFYFYYFEMQCRKRKTKLHLYGESIGAYVCDTPHQEYIGSVFGRRIYYRIIKKRYDFRGVSDYDYDYYLIGADYMGFHSDRKVIDVPIFDISDKGFVDYINDLFAVSSVKEITERYIFMDVVHKDRFDCSNVGMGFLNSLRDKISSEDFIVRAHPRQSKDIYDQIKIDSNPSRIPWEVYCANYDISDKVIISYGSGSAFLPMIFYGYDYYIISIEIKDRFKTIYENEWKEFLNILKQRGKKVYLAYSPEDVVKTFEEIRKLEHNE